MSQPKVLYHIHTGKGRVRNGDQQMQTARVFLSIAGDINSSSMRERERQRELCSQTEFLNSTQSIP